MRKIIYFSVLLCFCFIKLLYSQKIDSPSGVESWVQLGGRFTMQYWPENPNDGMAWLIVPNYYVKVTTHLGQKMDDDITVKLQHLMDKKLVENKRWF